jgi:glycosyltransferase involved in cell wall biosynthesis
MKIALVHDYIKDAGGAERVLRTLADMYPDAPIYTSFRIKGSAADKLFTDKTIIESPWAPILRPWRLYSPLRFLLPLVWKSIDLSDFDLVITSSSNYIARGFTVSEKTKVVCYCHTPPRFLYGFKTGMDWQKHWPVRVYGKLIAHFLRIFDYHSAQKISYWIANSKNVANRIKKYYGKTATVIYPPIEVEKITRASAHTKKKDYFLIAARLVGSKGLEEAIIAANQLGITLKIVGKADGFTSVESRLKQLGGKHITFLGRVSDPKLWKLYAEAKGFIALARDEDFGMTVVEAQAAGTPVIAFNGGGFKESVVNNKTGLLINDTSVESLEAALTKFSKTKWSKTAIQTNARKFSKEVFTLKMKAFFAKSVKNS